MPTLAPHDLHLFVSGVTQICSLATVNRLEISGFKSDSTSKPPLVYNNLVNYMRITVTVFDYSSCDVMVVKSELDRSLPDHVLGS